MLIQINSESTDGVLLQTRMDENKVLKRTYLSVTPL